MDPIPYSRSARRLLLFVVAALLVPMIGLAQFQTGNIFGTIVDNQDQPLPGVTVTLSGGGAPQVFITDSEGRFRFPSLAPGRYTVNAELAGFGQATRDVVVNIGRNTDLSVTLAPTVSETITVTAETPLLDVRRTGTGATIGEVELESVPSARDPWVVLQQVPGVVMDRINIGGNESGQQSVYVGKGTYSAENLWALDGVNITDPAASGSSPTYYDFDSFEEMQVTTGGSDPRLGTPGVGLNMVTKRGTNDWRGSARYFLTDGEFQSDPEIPAEAVDYLGTPNLIDNIADYGGEIGGPVLRDRLWLWGAYSRNEIDNIVAGGTLDSTLLENTNAKLNAQITGNNSATVFYSLGDKIKTGRGASPTRPAETAWNQSGPTTVWKFEDTHIFSPNFFLTGLYANIEGGFGLAPAGGLDVEVWRGTDNVWHNSYYNYSTDRPQDQYRIDGSSFFDTASLNHELKFGFSYANTPVTSTSIWPGSGNYHRFRSSGFCSGLSEELGIDLPSNCTTVFVSRPANRAFEGQTSDAYIGDTILLGNLTLQLGLRYDQFSGQNSASAATGNPVAPELLPQIDFPGDSQEFDHSAVSARLGATYNLGTAKKTLIRGAYNQYASMLGTAAIAFGNPFYYVQSITYFGQDINGDRVVQRNEIFDDLGYYFFAYVDPANPGSAEATIRLDYDTEPQRTDEFIIGLEHELLPSFVIGANLTQRNISEITWLQFEKHQGQGDYYTPADYVVAGQVTGTLPNGESYSLPYYTVREGLPNPVYQVLTNRPDYEQKYESIEIFATKRLANRWMLRGNFTLSDWTQEIGDGAIQDPTQLRGPALTSVGCTTCDGSIVWEQSAGSGAKQDIFINSGWSYNITGLYQLPLDFTVGASLVGREGYPKAYSHIVAADGVEKYVLLPGYNDERYEDIMNLDLRLAKEFRIAGRAGLTLSADVFNVMDERTVLQRDSNLASGPGAGDPSESYDHIRELQSPRVIRFGARLSF